MFVSISGEGLHAALHVELIRACRRVDLGQLALLRLHSGGDLAEVTAEGVHVSRAAVDTRLEL